LVRNVVVLDDGTQFGVSTSTASREFEFAGNSVWRRASAADQWEEVSRPDMQISSIAAVGNTLYTVSTVPGSRIKTEFGGVDIVVASSTDGAAWSVEPVDLPFVELPEGISYAGGDVPWISGVATVGDRLLVTAVDPRWVDPQWAFPGVFPRDSWVEVVSAGFLVHSESEPSCPDGWTPGQNTCQSPDGDVVWAEFADDPQLVTFEELGADPTPWLRPITQLFVGKPSGGFERVDLGTGRAEAVTLVDGGDQVYAFSRTTVWNEDGSAGQDDMYRVEVQVFSTSDGDGWSRASNPPLADGEMVGEVSPGPGGAIFATTYSNTGSTGLWRFDGSAWNRVELPGRGWISSVDPSGIAFVETTAVEGADIEPLVFVADSGVEVSVDFTTGTITAAGPDGTPIEMFRGTQASLWDFSDDRSGNLLIVDAGGSVVGRISAEQANLEFERFYSETGQDSQTMFTISASRDGQTWSQATIEIEPPQFFQNARIVDDALVVYLFDEAKPDARSAMVAPLG
ncbi:MAG: hypothetical protein KDB16_17690, partial [Acidimicrobiales bacterium]|nr:hypothetical protein [Acidimicrobiales bacterium]